MAVAFQSIGARADASTGTSTSAAIQAGVVAGDFLFAVHDIRNQRIWLDIYNSVESDWA
jgi:hypothetical protein